MSDLKKKRFSEKGSKPGFENLVLIYFKFQHNGFLDHCAMMALDIRTNTCNQYLSHFFHEIIESTGKIY